jgi:hypothetical protein
LLRPPDKPRKPVDSTKRDTGLQDRFFLGGGSGGCCFSFITSFIIVLHTHTHIQSKRKKDRKEKLRTGRKKEGQQKVGREKRQREVLLH